MVATRRVKVNMDWQTIQQVLRIVLNAAGGVLVGKGYLTEDMLTTLIGGLLSIGSVGWWFIWDRNRTA
jgi:hypothetical protein